MKRTTNLDPAKPNEWPAVLALPELQRVLPFGKNKLLSMAQEGELPAKKIRGRWLISKDSLLNWIAEK